MLNNHRVICNFEGELQLAWCDSAGCGWKADELWKERGDPADPKRVAVSMINGEYMVYKRIIYG